jgi:tripartite-type tricarboxylate transporter receptor subunit TctC
MMTTLNDPELRKSFTDLGVDVGGSSPEEFAAYIKSEIPKWTAIIRSAGIALE